MRAPRKTQPSFTVSAFFTVPNQVDHALSACLRLGIPRDLIDLAISEPAAAKYPQLKPGKNRDAWFAWTGKGALAGLLLSSLATLTIVLLQGFEVSSQAALVQLLGPDIGIVLGAVIGAVYGALKESKTNQLMLRSLEREDAMLLLVYMQPQEEAEKVSQVLTSHGGEAVQVEATVIA